ncbi:MAG TPA: hypothetical protein VHU23_14480 [Rhizomicrobium sp.]|jgi:hypothetical protein|nr:hypothetical protein [Rhizomicrobium sp.]
MTKWRVLGLLTAATIFTAAGMATASNFTSSAQTDYYAPGAHQFYMWCPASSNYMAMETGKSAEDAQLRLYDAAKATGRNGCWPVWQGRARV